MITESLDDRSIETRGVRRENKIGGRDRPLVIRYRSYQADLQIQDYKAGAADRGTRGL
jgi:hypothetical protein